MENSHGADSELAHKLAHGDYGRYGNGGENVSPRLRADINKWQWGSVSSGASIDHQFDIHTKHTKTRSAPESTRRRLLP